MGRHRSPGSTGRRFGAGLLILALLGVVGTSFLTSRAGTQERVDWSESHSLRDLSRGPKSISVIHSLRGPQRAGFSAFRTPPERLPLPVRRAMGEPIYGLNWHLAQRLPIRVLARAWAVPGNGYICILSLQGSRRGGAVGATCGSTEEALGHGLATTLLSERGAGVFHRSSRVIVGIAPDGAREVVAHGPGSVERIPVVNGAFMHRDEAAYPPDQLTLVK